jgi:ubiquinone/menaquinone biosynthesis C-methylase UbiE
MNIIFKIIIILFFLYVIYNYYRVSITIENFEDKFETFEKYNEIYDSEFINLYEIIYRDFTDIDYDYNVVSSKCFNNIDDKNVSILIAGCGVGKLCKKFKEKYNNIIGLDVSELMLNKAQSLYPNIKFTRGNLIKNNIFDKNKFSHIYIDERTLYYNKPDEIPTIIFNCMTWLKENGYLIVPIYNPDKLQLACRYYTSKYIDNKGNIHGFTYLNDFSHDCYYIRDELNKDYFDYYDKIVFDSGHKRIKKTTFYIQPKETVYDIILKNGFDLIYIEKIRTQIVGGYDLAIFKKKIEKTTVDELEKNKN